MNVHNYEKLLVWQKSMDLVEKVYRLREKFPSEEVYGITSQLRRGAVSIPSNIAEGSSRKTKKDFCQFMSISAGSAAEIQTQIKISRRLGFAATSVSEYDGIESCIIEVRKMLFKLVENLNTNV